ncbi:MAG: single-stranded-DNA-specific exonuclease RecJ [Prochlorotrichaceae cyanobacterium]
MTGNGSGNLPRQRWAVQGAEHQDSLSAIVEMTGLSPLVAQVLINRGITTPEAAQQFLYPETLELPTPLGEFADLPHSLELLAQAIDRQDPIAICGDYDADGMTSTALLLRALRSLGAQVDYAIPSRMKEGYGLNDRIVEEFAQDGVRLILTVDNGIAAYQPVALARSLGLSVIITDHHDLPPELPPANAILNPKLLPENSPYRGLAGVGVAYVLAVSLAKYVQKSQDFINDALELFTLGTIADLAPLVGVNRRWVKRGLARLPHSKVPGIRALIRVAGLEPEEPGTLRVAEKTPSKSQKSFKPDDIGFQLGPRINAIGRIGDPDIVIRLFTTEDWDAAYDLAQECEDANCYRRQLCQEIEAEAIAICEEQAHRLGEEKVLLVMRRDWHHGVIGIVASRLVERYGVPVFIATLENETQVRGSARSIPEFNVFEALEYCKDLLDRHGGHRAAGGFSVALDNLEAFRQRLIEFANQSLSPQHLKPLVKLDGEANLTDITWDLYHQIDSLHPWGIENPEPVFWSRNLRVLEQTPIGADRQHVRLSLCPVDGNQSFKALFWNAARYLPLPSLVDVAFHLKQNTWKGETSLQLDVVGVRPSSDAAASPPTQSPRKAHFSHNDRGYDCSYTWSGTAWELRIRNDRQQVLAVPEGSNQGLLGQDRISARTVDITEAKFAPLIALAQQALGLTR